MTGRALELERQRRAGLANMRQELLAPVTALVGYGEMLIEKARGLELEAIGPDLRRILISAQDLLELVDRLLGIDGMAKRQSGADLGELQTKLRHDLRNPLNAIKGYAELLLEELDEVGAAATRPDLEALLCEAGSLLSRIDVIIDFSSSEVHAALGEEARGAVNSMIANLVRTVRPIEQYAAPPHETGRILVVDDNSSNRDLLFRRLSHDGHHVARSDSGRRALEILEVENFDLILLDLLMPDLNGFQVLELLKADERLHDIPVIMISGLQETDSVIRCMEAGAEDYLAKPFNPVLLRARISACLERKRWRDRERRYVERIELERQRYESLLCNILPGQIVTRLNNGEVVIADRVEEATILFADLVGFTAVASRVTPAVLVDSLNRIFSAFDSLCRGLQIEKIKTIGDAYMAAAGLPLPRPDHAEVIADFALAMLNELEAVNATYRARLDAAGLHPDSITSLAEFRRVPFLRREDLLEPHHLIDRRFDPAVLPHATTSGSTGRRTTVYFDRPGYFLAKVLLKARARLTCGVRPWHRIALFQEEPYAGRSAERGQVRSFSIHAPVEDLLGAVAPFAPDVLYGFPGHLALLGEAAAGRLRPRLVFTSGELLETGLRQRLTVAFAAPVLDVYGCTEVKEIAFECPARAGYHLNADWLHLEAVGPDDPSGAAPGTLLVTSLYNYGMPLLRYALGDSGELLDHPCPCGRGLPLVRPTSGRLVDYFVLAGGQRVAPYSMTCAIELVPGMRQYQIVQTHRNRVVVRVVPLPHFDASARAVIGERLAPVLPGVAVTVEQVDRLLPDRSGKYRIVRSEVAAAG